MFILLWPCKSQKIETPVYLEDSLSFFCKKYISGWIYLLGLLHLLFRSTPARDDLLLPIMTPSGFTIGTSFTILLANRLSYFLELVDRSLMISLITKLPWVSAQCYRPIMYIVYFLTFLCQWQEVNDKEYIFRPPSVYPITSYLKMIFSFCISKLFSSSYPTSSSISATNRYFFSNMDCLESCLSSPNFFISLCCNSMLLTLLETCWTL